MLPTLSHLQRCVALSFRQTYATHSQLGDKELLSWQHPLDSFAAWMTEVALQAVTWVPLKLSQTHESPLSE